MNWKEGSIILIRSAGLLSFWIAMIIVIILKLFFNFFETYSWWIILTPVFIPIILAILLLIILYLQNKGKN